jgi:hypothetical protein
VQGKGFPNLLDNDWLWGGTMDDIHTTVTHGIRNTTDAGCPLFGNAEVRATGCWQPARSTQVVDHVLAISGQEHDAALATRRGPRSSPTTAPPATCETGTGDRAQGAPNLTDAIWLYGGDRATITDDSNGHLPRSARCPLRRDARLDGPSHRRPRSARWPPMSTAWAAARSPLKWVIMAVTLGIYYLVPWIRWDRGPSLPDQAVLVDMANRRFFFFWIEIWPEEFYFVAGLLIMAGLGLFLFTSALGRVWCGYACPQTVWTDLFILVERWIEGDRNARVRLWNQKWDCPQGSACASSNGRCGFLIGLATGGAWVFYFTDAPTLLRT